MDTKAKETHLPTDGLRIVGLEAKNVKRIRAVRLQFDPEQGLIVIGGRNAQGKTSLLDSILYALAGKGTIPDTALRDGQKKGKVTVNLGEFVVTRTFTETGGGSLKIEKADGTPISSPQTFLGGLMGAKLAFDPLAFIGLNPAKRLDAVQKLVGLDFGELDAKYEAIFNKRTEANRDVKRLEGELDHLEYWPDVGDVPVDVAALVQEAQEVSRHESDLTAAKARLSFLDGKAAGLQERIADLQQELEQVQALREASAFDIAELEKTAPKDAESINAKLANAEANNEKARANARYKEVESALEDAQGRAACMTANLEAIKQEKKNALAAASFPVDGLSFDESGVLFNGQPFAEASGAEQVRASVGIGAAMHPELRVQIIRNGSLLDDESMALLADLAEQHGSQVWIERVGDGDDGAIIIEDGMVRKETD